MALKLITPGTVEELFAFIETLSFSFSPNNLFSVGKAALHSDSNRHRYVMSGMDLTELAITNMDETLKRFFPISRRR